MHRSIHRITLALIAIGALAGLYAAALRFRAENRNRGVEMAIDAGEAATLAAVAHTSLDDVLLRFRALGVESLAISEDTPETLEDAGLLEVNATRNTLAAASPALLDRIAQGFADRGLVVEPGYKGDDPLWTAFTDPSGRAVSVHGGYASLRTIGIGPDPATAAAAKRCGLGIVARIGNYPGASLPNMTRVLTRLRDVGATTVVFSGTEVLGYRGAHKDAAAAFEQSGLRYGQIEFGKQKGDEKLAAALRSQFVRVHSIAEGEMGLLDRNEAIDRFARAARERNIRLCYIRMLSFAGADPVQENLDYIKAIKVGTMRRGEMGFRAATLFGDPGVPRWAFILIGLGVGAGAGLLLRRFVPMSSAAEVCVGVGMPLLAAALVGAGGETGRKMAALLASLVFPTLACLRREVLDDDAAEPPMLAGAAMRRAFGALVSASGVTALGIVYVIGLLASLPFMVKTEQFAGIKLAHGLPILLIGIVAITGLPAEGGWRRACERAAALMAEPIRVGALLACIVAALGLGMAIMRTGNEPGVGVSGAELRARAVLDKVLPVRPRTKEFLIGHPCFVLAVGLWWRGRRRWAKPLFVVGAVGQVSILNTFCHIHTPLYLSFIRDLTGLAFGAALGAAVLLVVEWLLIRRAARNGSAACA